MTGSPIPEDPLSRSAIGAAIEVHRALGPGLLESVYERCLRYELELRGHRVDQQREVPIRYKELSFAEVLRFDLLIDDRLLIELKCVEQVHPRHKAQLFSYMKLLSVPVGLILNFHDERLTDGISRLYLRDS